MQRWTGQTSTVVLNQLHSVLTKLPRSVRSLVLNDYPDVGLMPAVDKTTVVILAGTPQPEGPAVAERIDGVFNSDGCKEYWCKALASLGSEAEIIAALQEQRLVILQSGPLSVCKSSASKGTPQRQQRDQLKKAVDKLVAKASHGCGDKALDVLLDLAKGDRHVVFVHLVAKAYWSEAKFWEVAEQNGNLIKRRPSTYRFACSLQMPNFTTAQSNAIKAALAPQPAVSTAQVTAAAAAANAGGAGSSAAAAAAGKLVAPPAAAAAVGAAIVTGDTNRKRRLPADGAVSPNKSPTAPAATAAAIASDGDGVAHGRKRLRSTSVNAPVTPHGIEKVNPVTINPNKQAVPPDTANCMAAVADDDGVSVELSKEKNMVELDYARAKKILAECSGNADRIDSMMKDFKDVLTASEYSCCQALIDSCRGVLAGAEGKQQRLLDIAEAGEDGPFKLMCIQKALAEFCDVVEGNVQPAGKQLKAGVMNVCVNVGERMLDEHGQQCSSLGPLDSSIKALGCNFGVDGRVTDRIMDHRIATTATQIADECRSLLSQPVTHSMHQILVAVQKLRVAMTELASFVQQSSCEACECFRIVLHK